MHLKSFENLHLLRVLKLDSLHENIGLDWFQAQENKKCL